jgi:hypothetical protein
MEWAFLIAIQLLFIVSIYINTLKLAILQLQAFPRECEDKDMAAMLVP